MSLGLSARRLATRALLLGLVTLACLVALNLATNATLKLVAGLASGYLDVMA